jgi:preprotein translocase subunit YajC
MTSWSILAQGGFLEGGGAQLIFMMGAMFLIMYLLVFRPQRKREAERKAMIAAVKKNDRILTSGGIIGTVTHARDEDVTIRIDDEKNVRIKVSRQFITSVLGKDEG